MDVLENRNVRETILICSSFGALIIVQRRQHALVGFNECRHQWGLPGGTVEAGASAYDAALRELAEETGIRVNQVSLVARANFEFAGDGTTYVAAVFGVRLDNTGALVERDELSEFGKGNPRVEPLNWMNDLDSEVIRRVLAQKNSSRTMVPRRERIRGEAALTPWLKRRGPFLCSSDASSRDDLGVAPVGHRANTSSAYEKLVRN